MSNVVALVGAQYGSEGKGVVAHYLANDFDVHVRVGGPNAGHSFAWGGMQFKMQALPVGWTNPNAWLVIGANAVINLDILEAEIKAAEAYLPGVWRRVLIDGNATILEPRHHEEEGGVHGEAHREIGSTGEGIGPARRDRLMRKHGRFMQFRDVDPKHPLRTQTADTVLFLAKTGSNILLEGTQGFGLSLVHGPWPKVTSADTTAAQLLADCGIAPQRLTKTIMVARSMPIRVAGNSGPLFGETDWTALSKRLGRDVLERTTVTKKVRRIGEWDSELMARAALVNHADEIALTFADYIDPRDHNVVRYTDLSTGTKKFVDMVVQVAKAPVTLIGTGYSETAGWSCVDMRKQ